MTPPPVRWQPAVDHPAPTITLDDPTWTAFYDYSYTYGGQDVYTLARVVAKELDDSDTEQIARAIAWAGAIK
jgi:hypothetical protein